ncbi:alpha-E domain-containing protein [bacterium]|nr:alpha-E domain-containing protein [bacterium]
MMLSRVAEHFYWFGHYIERAENTARIILAESEMILDVPDVSHVRWRTLIETCGQAHTFDALDIGDDEASVLGFLLTDTRNPGSILQTVLFARENLRVIRDRVPRELSEALLRLRDHVKNKGAKSLQRSAARSAYLRGVIDLCQMFRGAVEGSMSRGPEYQFMRLGRMLERADMTTRVMDVRYDKLLPDTADNLAGLDEIQWVSALNSLSAFQMYRREVRGPVRALDVIEFLLHNHAFPRSLQFTLAASRDAAGLLPTPGPVCKALDSALTKIEGLSVASLSRDGDKLHKAIDNLQIAINGVHGSIHEAYFKPQ